jgi:hypothetical protein
MATNDERGDRILRGRELLGALIVNPDLIEKAKAAGITPALFDRRYKHDTDWDIIERCWSECQEYGSDLAIERLNDEGLSDDVHRTFWSIRQRRIVVDDLVVNCTKVLVALGPYVKPPIEYHTDTNPTPASGKPSAKAKRKPQSKEFLGTRRNTRAGELKVLSKYLKREDLKAIAAKFAGRDVFDPEDVARREIGDSVKLTEAEMFEIEDRATDYGRQQKWGRPAEPDSPAKPYRFSFRTITCYDKTDDEVRLNRKRRSNKRTNQRLKTERLEKKTMQTTVQATMQTQSTKSKYASVMEAMIANVRAQEESLYNAIRGEKSTITELMMHVRRTPCWHSLASGNPATFRRKVSDRLDELKKAGRIVDDYEHGVRIVRRA